MPASKNIPPKYIKLLPAIYQRQGDNPDVEIESYLKIFEKILTGEITLPESNTLYRRKGLGETLDVLANMFYPRFSFLFSDDDEEFIPPILDKNQEENETNLNSYVGASYAEYSDEEDSQFQLEFQDWLKDILDWMSDRADTPLNPNWDADTKRLLIAYIMPLFRQRGTQACLQLLLQIYLGNGNPYDPLKDNKIIKDINVYDLSTKYLPTDEDPNQQPLQPYLVGVNFNLTNNYVEGQPLLGAQRPYCYAAQIDFKVSDFDVVNEKMSEFDQALNRERPAIGYCKVIQRVPFMTGPKSTTQLNVNSYLLKPDSLREILADNNNNNNNLNDNQTNVCTCHYDRSK